MESICKQTAANVNLGNALTDLRQKLLSTENELKIEDAKLMEMKKETQKIFEKKAGNEKQFCVLENDLKILQTETQYIEQKQDSLNKKLRKIVQEISVTQGKRISHSNLLIWLQKNDKSVKEKSFVYLEEISKISESKMQEEKCVNKPVNEELTERLTVNQILPSSSELIAKWSNLRKKLPSIEKQIEEAGNQLKNEGEEWQTKEKEISKILSEIKIFRERNFQYEATMRHRVIKSEREFRKLSEKISHLERELTVATGTVN